MEPEIVLLLLQDGVANGAIYALIAIAIVLVYAVTRIVFIPQGTLVAYAALTYVSLQSGAFPTLVWLLLAMGAIVFILELAGIGRSADGKRPVRALVLYVLLPAALWAVMRGLAGHTLPLLLQIAITVITSALLGCQIYRLSFASIAGRASILSMLIVAVAVDLVLVGLGLLVFGSEGFRAKPLSDAGFELGAVVVTVQSLYILFASAALMAGLYYIFNRTILGKALRATSVNRLGSRLVGIRTANTGELAFALAGMIAAISGVLISSGTTVYYDLGFLIGLKALVAAIIGALASYPMSVGAALLVGVIESFASFSASTYKEAILFALVLPFLLWRSIGSVSYEDEDDE